jgi:hypothetical protein
VIGLLVRALGAAAAGAIGQALGSLLGDKLHDALRKKLGLEPQACLKPQVRLERVETSDAGTFGRLEYGSLTFHTAELPWRDNQDNISCIPAGTYPCKLTFSPKYQREMYLVENVPGREGVRIHSLNYVGDKSKGLKCDAEGCIGLGYERGYLNGQKAILKSREAVKAFEDAMAGAEFDLVVVDIPKEPA